jgi:hypothetical protein
VLCDEYSLHKRLYDLAGEPGWLRARRPGDRRSIPGRGEKIFALVCVQTGSGAHPAYCTMGTGGPFPGNKARSVRKCDHPSPSSIYYIYMSRVSSGIIVSDYGLDDRAIGVRSLAGEKDFSSSLCVQTGPGAHPPSCTMVTGVLSPRGKARPGRDADHSPLFRAEVVNE